MDSSKLLGTIRRYRIVAGIDLSEYADIVLEHALDQAARHQAPELHLVTVRERRKPSSDEVKQALWERVYPALETFNRHGTGWRARLHVRRGKPDQQLALLAAEVRADLLVIGQFGLHHPRATARSFANRVLHEAPCPTLVVGMPAAFDHPQCTLCAAVRETSDGEHWFCSDHTSSKRPEHVMTPMTEWTAGEFIVSRAA